MIRLITTEDRAAHRAAIAPKGAVKVSDRQSDAVAYLYAKQGQPVAMIFVGTAASPLHHVRFTNDANRERFVREAFESRRERTRYMIERRADPSATATRNRAIKTVLERRFGRGKVRVTGGRGTAYGWVHVTVNAPRPEGQAYHDGRSEITRLILDAGIRLGHYDSADYGSGYELNIDWSGR
jgi:hypothetical protein